MEKKLKAQKVDEHELKIEFINQNIKKKDGNAIRSIWRASKIILDVHILNKGKIRKVIKKLNITS